MQRFERRKMQGCSFETLTPLLGADVTFSGIGAVVRSAYGSFLVARYIVNIAKYVSCRGKPLQPASFLRTIVDVFIISRKRLFYDVKLNHSVFLGPQVSPGPALGSSFRNSPLASSIRCGCRPEAIKYSVNFR